MTEDERNKTIERWSELGLTSGLDNQYVASVDTANDSFDLIQFPIIKRVMSATLAGGGSYKSEKQQLKESRINKLRQLQGLKPNIKLPDDVIVDGLVSVQPLSAPTGILVYMDYKYDTVKKVRKKKLEKLNKLFRKDKLKYIGEILQKIINKKWMT